MLGRERRVGRGGYNILVLTPTSMKINTNDNDEHWHTMPGVPKHTCSGKLVVVPLVNLTSSQTISVGGGGGGFRSGETRSRERGARASKISWHGIRVITDICQARGYSDQASEMPGGSSNVGGGGRKS